MDHRGGVVVGVHPPEGIPDDGAPEIPLQAGSADALVDRFLQAAAHQLHLLAQPDKQHSHSRILTDGDVQLPGGGKVFQHVRKDL